MIEGTKMKKYTSLIDFYGHGTFCEYESFFEDPEEALADIMEDYGEDLEFHEGEMKVDIKLDGKTQRYTVIAEMSIEYHVSKDDD